VDLAPYDENVDPVADARAIVNELRHYDPELHEKPRWLVLNKVDVLPAEERAQRAAEFVRGFGWQGRSFIISALTGEGCPALVYAIMEHLEKNQETVTGADAGRPENTHEG
jgi:GTPase